VWALGRPVIRFSDPFFLQMKEIRSFLFTRMYRAPRVMRERAQATAVIDTLFPLYLSQPDLLPLEWRRDIGSAPDDTHLARSIADYVSGMTDRFALEQYAKYQQTPL